MGRLLGNTYFHNWNLEVKLRLIGDTLYTLETQRSPHGCPRFTFLSVLPTPTYPIYMPLLKSSAQSAEIFQHSKSVSLPKAIWDVLVVVVQWLLIVVYLHVDRGGLARNKYMGKEVGYDM